MSLLIILDCRGKIEGTQIHALALCKELKKKKKKYLLLYNKKNNFLKIAKKKKINIYYLDFLASSPKNIFRFLQIYEIQKKIERIMLNNSITNILLYNSYLKIFLPKLISSKIYCYNHAGFSNFDNLKIFKLENLFNLKNLVYTIYNRYCYYNYSGINKILCSSTEAIKKMRGFFRIEKKKFVKVNNSIQLQKITKTNHLKNKLKYQKIILGLGRFSESKGILDFCEVASAMKNCNDVKFYYIAPNDIKFKQFEMKTKMKFKKYVTFLEKMPNEKVLRLMKNSYIFLFLSHRESSSLSCIESMSQGTPVVVWKDAGNNDIIKTNVNGFKISFRDFSTLQKKIKFLLNNPKAYLNLALSTIIYSRKFNINKTVDHLYNKVFSKI